MNKFSLTQGGVLLAVVGTILVQYVGLTESCSTELLDKAPLLIGGIMAWVGRYRLGDVTALGFKK